MRDRFGLVPALCVSPGLRVAPSCGALVMNPFLKTVISVAGTLFAMNVAATPIAQVDLVTLTGATYRYDVWTLTLTSPVASSVSYVAVPDDELGANLQNVTTNWVAAINADPILGAIVTAAALPYIPASSFTQFTLTAITPGVPFSASVSVVEACDCNGNESEPLTVEIQTTTAASVAEPEAIALVLIGLVLLQIHGYPARLVSRSSAFRRACTLHSMRAV